MNDLPFYVLLTVFQSYRTMFCMIMKGCVQRNSVYDWEDFTSSEDRARSARLVDQRLTHWATGASVFLSNQLYKFKKKRKTTKFKAKNETVLVKNRHIYCSGGLVEYIWNRFLQSYQGFLTLRKLNLVYIQIIFWKCNEHGISSLP